MAIIDLSSKPQFHTQVIFDELASPPIQSEEGVSRVTSAPFHVQINAIPDDGTSMDLQVRVNPDADWVTVITYTAETTPTVYVFGHDRVNFVRTVRNGAGVFKVYVQG